MATNLKLTSDKTAWQLNVEQKQPYILETSEKYMDRNIKVVPKIGSLSIEPSSQITYSTLTEEDGLVIPSGGYLYINPGYHDAAKIALATLVPNENTPAAGVSQIMAGYKAYDQDGNLVVGTLRTVDSEISSTYYSTSASGAIADSLIPAGNVSTPHYIKAGSVSVGGGSLSAPTIAYTNNKNAIEIESGATSSNITLTEETSAPSDKFYFTVAANAPAISGSVSAETSARTQTFTKGWIESASLTANKQTKSTNFNIAGDSETKYYSLNKATVGNPSVGEITTTVSDVQPTANLAISTTTGDKSADIVSTDVKFVTTKPSSGFFIGIKGGSDANAAAGTVSTSIGATTVTVTEGYIDKAATKTTSGHTEDSKNINLKASSTTKYLQLPTSTCTISGGSGSVKTKGTASASAAPSSGLGTNALTLATSQPTGNYWTVTAAASSPVVEVSAITYKHTEGYVKNMASAAQNRALQTVSAGVDSKNYYIPQAGYSAALGTTTNAVNIEGTATTQAVPTTYEVKVNTAGYDYAAHSIKTINVYMGEYTATTA